MSFYLEIQHTLGIDSYNIDARAYNHDIVHASKAALASNWGSISAHQIAVDEYGRIVKLDAPGMQFLCIVDLVRMEEIPTGIADYFVWCEAKDIDD